MRERLRETHRETKRKKPTEKKKKNHFVFEIKIQGKFTKSKT